MRGGISKDGPYKVPRQRRNVMNVGESSVIAMNEPNGIFFRF